MIIDIHAHIGQGGARKSELPDLLQYREAARVDRLLISNLDAASQGDGAQDRDEPDANLATLAVHAEHDFLLPLYWVRPGRLDSNLHAFAGALDAEPFVGALFAPELNGFGADDDELSRYLAILADLKGAAVFWTSADERARPARVYTIAQRHPSVPFVLYQASSDTHWREALECAERANTRRDARLYLVTGQSDQDDIVEAIQAAGEDHVMFGSDAPGDKALHADQVQRRLARFEEILPPDQLAKVIGLNAERVFRLG